MGIARLVSHPALSPTQPGSGWSETANFIFFNNLLKLFRGTTAAAASFPTVLLVLVGLLLAPGAQASARKAKNLYEDGRKAEVQKNYDQALTLYEQAKEEDTGNQRYELAVRRMQFVAGQAHVDRGQKLRDEGHLEDALQEFRRAVEIDPSSSIAVQEEKRTLEMIDKRQTTGPDDEKSALDDKSPLETDRRARADKIAALTRPPDLQPLSSQPINLSITNQESKVIFETIGKLSGVNVLFDPEYQDKKIPVELQNVTLFEALDYVSLIAKAFWKPISHNAIFITNDNTNKRRDYEEEVVKTFYLTNVATPQEMQEIMTAIRGLTDLRRMFPVNSMNALVVRGPAGKLALAEKVINDVDIPRAEVIVDLMVIETSKTKTRELAITPMSGKTPGIDIPIIFKPRNGITTQEPSGTDTGSGSGSSSTTGVPLSQLGSLSSRDWVTTMPDARVAALLSSSDSRLLQSPRVRAVDGFPASLRIGDRIPIATGSFQPGIGGVGVNPLVNTQFNFEDVGVNVDMTPKIHNDREISLHIEVEVSTVRDHVDIGGIQQPIIGQRTITHDIRIREGEASVMGGLNQTQTFKTKSGVPFLGEVPILGQFFSSTSNNVQENEILIVLVPHIVRLPEIKSVNLQEVASGTDQIFQVRYGQDHNDKPALPAVGQNGHAPEQPATVAENQTPAGGVPVPAETPPASTEPVTAAPEPAAEAPPQPAEQPAAQTPAATPGATQQPRIVFEPGTVELGVGAQATVDVVIENVTQLFGSPLRIAFDPRVVRVTDITRGSFLEGEGMDLIFAKNIRAEIGQAAVNISRFPGTGGSDGRGVLVTLHLEGVAAGSSKIGVTSTGARNAEAQSITIPAGQLPVVVR